MNAMFIDISDLQVRYPGRDKAAVEHVSFGLHKGQMGVLIGPSGCGKTTLLRAVAGLEPLSGGVIRMNDQVISGAGVHLVAENRRIGMVFQDYALFPHLSVEKNIDFGVTHWPAQKRQSRVRDMLSLVGLTSSAQRYPHELSGGQQQRVALARALAPEPLLLLLDEPFSNLDVDLRERLAQELREILQLAQITALFVTP
jgi:iron(III) transport system ATP-binding protein